MPGEVTFHIELDSQMFLPNSNAVKGTAVFYFYPFFPPNVSYRVSKEISVMSQTVLKFVKIPKSAVKHHNIS